MTTALIIGATGGIGSAITADLASHGWQLHVAARDEGRLQPLVEQGMTAHCLNAQDRAALDVAVKAAQQEAGDEPLAMVMAVGSIVLKPAHRTDHDLFMETLQQNLVTAFNLVAAAGAHCRKGGSVLLFSSAAARMGLMNHEAIAAAKAGVEGLVRAAAATYAGRGLRVNALAPGLVDTPLAGHLTGSPAALEASQKLHPLGRIGQPEDLVAAARWLLDPASTWVTGQVIGIDGGLSVCRAG